MKLQREG